MNNSKQIDGVPPDFDQLTGINSRALVSGLTSELRQYFGTELPTELETELLRRLLAFFALHSGWRARILRAPAPDFIKIFLRRWASELLFHRCRALYEALPASYRTGGPLPPLRGLSSLSAAQPEMPANIDRVGSVSSDGGRLAQITMTE